MKRPKQAFIKRNKPAVEVDLPLKVTLIYFEQQRETRGQYKSIIILSTNLKVSDKS